MMIMKAIAVLAALLLAGCNEPGRWEGAVVVKICRDGSQILRLRNGSYVTVWNQRVDDPETVCSQ